MLSVCVTALVLHLHHKDPYPQPPAWLENLLLKKTTNRVSSTTILDKEQNISVIDSASNKVEPTRTNNANQKVEEKSDCQSRTSEKWREVARVINMISFLVFLSASTLTYVICVALWYLG